MIQPSQINELAKKLIDALPKGIQNLPNDVEKSFRAILQGTLSRLDLISREEFDAQMAVLERTRAKLDKLEQQLADMSQTNK